MYCDNCGCELGENSRKCPVCGKEFPMINPVQEDEEGTTVLTSSQMGHADVQENTGAQNQNGEINRKIRIMQMVRLLEFRNKRMVRFLEFRNRRMVRFRITRTS